MGWFFQQSPPPPPPPPLPPPPSRESLVLAGAHRGLQVGSTFGLAISPIVYGLVRKKLPPRRSAFRSWYSDVLPLAGFVGLAGGALVGGAKAYRIAYENSDDALQLWAHGGATFAEPHAWLRPTAENERKDQWESVFVGGGALIASPGPGSILFSETAWLPRFGGGLAVGAAVGTGCFYASRHPRLAPHVKAYLPEGMQPKEAEAPPTPEEWAPPVRWLLSGGVRELLAPPTLQSAPRAT